MESKYDVLQYGSLWVSLGIVDGKDLERQLREFSKPNGDHHSEHYRWQAFRAYVERTPRIETPLLRQLLEMLRADPDQYLARSCLVHVIDKCKLSMEDLDVIANGFESDLVRARVLGEKLLVRLRQGTLTDELFEKAVRSGIRAVQQQLLRMRLTSEQALTLEQYGITRAIRNRARAHQLSKPNE